MPSAKCRRATEPPSCRRQAPDNPASRPMRVAIPGAEAAATARRHKDVERVEIANWRSRASLALNGRALRPAHRSVQHREPPRRRLSPCHAPWQTSAHPRPAPSPKRSRSLFALRLRRQAWLHLWRARTHPAETMCDGAVVAAFEATRPSRASGKVGTGFP